MATPPKPLTMKQILEWADRHYAWAGGWPTSRCGPILDQPDRTWEGVNTALRKGGCGLRGGTTLYQVLAKRRKAQDPREVVPDLTLKDVLQWVDSHQAITGEWPYRDAGAVRDCPRIS